MLYYWLLQWLCDLAKKSVDVQVVRVVPVLKRSLERLTFSVQGLLSFHNCLDGVFQISTFLSTLSRLSSLDCYCKFDSFVSCCRKHQPQALPSGGQRICLFTTCA